MSKSMEELLNQSFFSDEELKGAIEKVQHTIDDLEQYGSWFRVNVSYLRVVVLYGLTTMAQARGLRV